MNGTLFGIGVGPGDPELLTLKAIKTIADCDILTVPDSGTDNHIAFDIANEYVGTKPIIHLDLPMTRDKSKLMEKRMIAADMICVELDAGKNVGFLTIGDPMLYSTYSYLHTIIVSRGYTAKVIPGITSFCAAAAALGQPLCESDEALHIIPALYDAQVALNLDGTKVFMKSGKKLNDVIDILKEKKVKAKMAQRVGMDGEQLFDDLDKNVESDYFSIIIVKD